MHKLLSLKDIQQMPKIPRLNLINVITGYKSANLIGTIDQDQNLNLAIFSSVVHLGSNPPLIGFITRPTIVPRHTYLNIKKTGYYTINHLHQEYLEQAHQTSAKYPPEVSEFEVCGFTPEFIKDFPAPFVKESKIKIGMKICEEQHIKANDTILVIGQVQYIMLPDQVIQNDGFVDLEAMGTVALSGLDTYLIPRKLARMSYAKPEKELEVESFNQENSRTDR
ncbi:MAG: flavin reductase family protein [Candidatus Cyclobacteriaceae bacterium M3_2C_046]